MQVCHYLFFLPQSHTLLSFRTRRQRSQAIAAGSSDGDHAAADTADTLLVFERGELQVVAVLGEVILGSAV